MRERISRGDVGDDETELRYCLRLGLRSLPLQVGVVGRSIVSMSVVVYNYVLTARARASSSHIQTREAQGGVIIRLQLL